MKTVLSAVMITGLSVALFAQSPDQPSRSRSGSGVMQGCQQMMAAMEKRKAEMKALNDQLRQKLQQMNAAEGQAKIAATAAVVNDLAAQHLKMHDMMMSMSEQRMGHMMGHMGDAAGMQQCPMMKGMAADAKATAAGQSEHRH